MFDSSDSGEKKGPFHRLTGRPFVSYVSPRTAELQKDRDNRQQVAATLSQQKKECDQKIDLWTEEVGRTNEELASLVAQETALERSLSEQRKYWTTPDIRNAPSGMLGHVLRRVPLVGTVMTLFNVGQRGYQYRQTQNQQAEVRGMIETNEGYRYATENALAEIRKDKSAFIKKEKANWNQLENTQNALNKSMFYRSNTPTSKEKEK